MLIRLTLLLALMAALLCACDPGAKTANGGRTSAGKRQQYPIPLSERPFQEAHDSVKKAWQLVEISYFVVNEKYINAAKDTRQSISKEIDTSIFGVNKEVEALFKDAIKAEPDNPINYAAYAIYLKPRKRLTEKGFTNSYADALANIDKAIELWPDESSFYITKIYIMSAPHQAHEWLRAGAMEDVAIAENFEEINKLFTMAEKYDPDNSFIDYWHAQLLFRYTPPVELDGVTDKIHREINSGNNKKDNYFIFGAPLLPRTNIVLKPLLFAGQTEPQYVDQATHFGGYSGETINVMVQELLNRLQWPKDKQKILDLMYLYYNLGRTEPFDRSYFSMQQMILEKIRRDVDIKSDEAKKLAEVAFFLDEQYQSVGNKLFEMHLFTDPAKVGGAGISEVETRLLRQQDLKPLLQGPQGAYLKRFMEEMNVSFPMLPEDPEQW